MCTLDQLQSTMANRDVNLMESPPDKAVLVGDVGVGKTSLFVRFKTGEFSDNVSHNPREGEYQKKWNINGKEVSVSKADEQLLWGTGELECMHSAWGLDPYPYGLGLGQSARLVQAFDMLLFWRKGGSQEGSICINS